MTIDVRIKDHNWEIELKGLVGSPDEALKASIKFVETFLPDILLKAQDSKQSLES